MDNYTLYLVKRAYYKKQLIKHAAQANYNIDPIKVYDMKAQEIQDAVDYRDANKLRLREQRAKEYAKRYAIYDAIIGGLSGAAVGGVGTGVYTNSPIGAGIGALIGGTGGGIAGYYTGKYTGNKAGYAAGEEEGTKLDIEDFKARRARALQDFHQEQTGSLHPSDLQKTKAGVRIYEAL